MYEQGAGRYLGQFRPDEVFNLSEDVVAHRFIASETGPICMNGSDFHTMVRDQQKVSIFCSFCKEEVCVVRSCVCLYPQGLRGFQIWIYLLLVLKIR